MNETELIRALMGESTWLGRFSSALVAGASADDLAQETVLVTLRQQGDGGSTHRANAGGELRPWLAGVARRLHLSHRRSEARRGARERAVAKAEATAATADVVMQAETHQRVVNAVMSLSEPARTTILLRFWDNLPPREVAVRMGVPVETVRTRTKRALETLRGKLDDSFGDRRAWLLPLAAIAQLPRGDADHLATSSKAATVPSKGAAALLVGGLLGVAALAVATLADPGGDGNLTPRSNGAESSASAVAVSNDEVAALPRVLVDAATESNSPATATDPRQLLAKIDACWEIEDYWRVIDELGASSNAESLVRALRITIAERVAPPAPGRRNLREMQARDARFEVLLQALLAVAGPVDAAARVQAMGVRLPRQVRNWIAAETVPPPAPPPPPPGAAARAAAFEAELLDAATRDRALAKAFDMAPTERLMSLVLQLPPSRAVTMRNYDASPGRTIAWIGGLAARLDAAGNAPAWADALASRIATLVDDRFRFRPDAEQLRRIDLSAEIATLERALTRGYAAPAAVPILTTTLLQARSISGVPRSEFAEILEDPKLRALVVSTPTERKMRTALARVRGALLWLEDVHASDELIALWRNQPMSRRSTGYFLTVLQRCEVLSPGEQAGFAPGYRHLVREHDDARVRIRALALYLRWESDDVALAALLDEIRREGRGDTLEVVARELPMRWHRGAGEFEVALDWLDWALTSGTRKQIEELLDGLEDGYDNVLGETAGDEATRVLARLPKPDDARLSKRARQDLERVIHDLRERVTKSRAERRGTGR
ncbi:MAG: RNA polymerase sigma factor [bacterium]|nr:RNA polymerase sigma factor [bacterium]